MTLKTSNTVELYNVQSNGASVIYIVSKKKNRKNQGTKTIVRHTKLKRNISTHS